VVKWGYEGPLLIYLVLPPTTKARTLVGLGCARLRAGHAQGRKGVNVYEGVQTGVGKAHTAAGVGCKHLYGGGACTPTRGGAHGC
jgi:hypothetical protein